MVLVGNYNGSFPGAAGNPNFARYAAVLEAINVLQGGTRAATGKAGEPIEFLGGVYSEPPLPGRFDSATSCRGFSWGFSSGSRNSSCSANRFNSSFPNESNRDYPTLTIEKRESTFLPLVVPYIIKYLGLRFCDTFKSGVWEPAANKLNSIAAATEAASCILSIDETVRNPQSEKPGGIGLAPGGGQGGQTGRMVSEAMGGRQANPAKIEDLLYIYNRLQFGWGLSIEVIRHYMKKQFFSYFK